MINKAISPCKIGNIYEKRACKLNSKTQNSCSLVKIGFKILTTSFFRQKINNLYENSLYFLGRRL